MNRFGITALRCLLLVLLVASFASCPRVRPLRMTFDQGSHGASAGYSEFAYSDYFHGTQQLADDFTVPEARPRVVQLQWWGAYRNNIPAVDNFVVRVFNDDGVGMPETTAASGSRVSVTRRATGDTIEIAGDTLDVFQYTLQLDSPLELDPEALYFLSIVNDTGRWIWCAADSADEGNNFGVARYTADGVWGSVSLDMSFRIWGR